MFGRSRGSAKAPRTVPSSPEGLRPWQLIRYAPRQVWLVTALFALILAAWSVLVPLYHAPDEPNHADAVMRIEEGRGWPSAQTSKVTDEGVGAIAASPFGRATNRLSFVGGPVPAAMAVGRNDRPAWQDLKAVPRTSGAIINQIPEHPPGYYYYEGLLLRLGGAAGWQWDIAVSVMRLLSAFLIMWLPLLSWAAAWRLTGSRLAGITASIFPLAVPELSHVGASVNNDNLVTLAGAAALVGLVCAMRGDRSKSTAIWTGLWVAVAMWTKAFGLVLVPMVVLVYGTPWVREVWARRRGRGDAAVGARRWLPERATGVAFLLSTGLAIGLGIWWYVISEIRYGAMQPSSPNFPPGRLLGHDNVLFSRYPTQQMLQRWWGDFGWFEVQLPWRLVVVASVLVGAIAIYGIVRARGRRIASIMVMWPTVVTWVVVSAGVTSYYLRTHYVRGISGRYLFIGFTGVAVLVGAGFGAMPAKIARWTPLALLLGALAMQAEAAHLVFDNWWRPAAGTIRQGWNALSSWSAWPVGVLFAGGAVLLLLIVAAIVTFLRFAIVGGEGVVAVDRTIEAAEVATAVDVSTAAEQAADQDESCLQVSRTAQK